MAFNVYYRAWDTSANAAKTGDAANHTVSVEVNGSAVTGLTEAEVANGLYRVELSDVQCPEGARFGVYGSSSTANVAIIGETGVRPFAVESIQSGLASQESVNDIPTVAEFEARTLATAAYATAANQAAIIGYIDSEIAAILTDTGTTLDTKIDALNALLVKVKAAVYDSAAVEGGVITLSNGATQTVDASGRVTAE